MEATAKTVTLSDDELAALQAVRQIVADAQHPARPTAIAALDRIKAAPTDDFVWPTIIRSGAQPLDVSEPNGHRCSMLDWDNRFNPMADIVTPVGQDLHVALMRPNGAAIQRWPLEVGADHRRALYRLAVAAYTRPHG